MIPKSHVRREILSSTECSPNALWSCPKAKLPSRKCMTPLHLTSPYQKTKKHWPSISTINHHFDPHFWYIPPGSHPHGSAPLPPLAPNLCAADFNFSTCVESTSAVRSTAELARQSTTSSWLPGSNKMRQKHPGKWGEMIEIMGK